MSFTPTNQSIVSFEPYGAKLGTEHTIEHKGSSCLRTRQGGRMIADSNGFVCDRSQLTEQCCPNDARSPFDCHTCDASIKCCSKYEYCVACCMRPQHQSDLDFLRLQSTHSVIKTGTTFEVCQFKCRTSSGSVVHENSYRSSKVMCVGLFVQFFNSSFCFDWNNRWLRFCSLVVLVLNSQKHCFGVIKSPLSPGVSVNSDMSHAKVSLSSSLKLLSSQQIKQLFVTIMPFPRKWMPKQHLL
jgi:hypothetical protein